MSCPRALSLRIRQIRLAVWCCALGCGVFLGTDLARAQGTKLPAMGSAGMTGGTAPSGAPGEASKPAVPSATESQKPTSTESEAKKSSVTPAPRPLNREASPSAAPASPLADSGIPPFHLARFTLEGVVSGDRANITAEIDVDVNRHEDGYHDVPLRLTQAHVLSKEYSGPGQDGPVVDGPVEDGIVWRFAGFGTHHLTLKMWVPVRPSPAGRQLFLSLPTMPRGFDAQLNLAIPSPGSPVVVRASRELSVLSNERSGEVHRVLANIQGPRLDLTWSEPPDQQTSFQQATTSVTLRREGDRFVATAEQSLLPENAGVKEAEIKLPDGFDLDRLTGPQLKGHEAILGRTGWRKVSFRETSGERFDLTWVLSAPFPADGGTLHFDGLVADAHGQSGRIQLLDFPGYQMVPRLGQFVRRAPPSSPQATEVFEFTRQPFRLSWDVQRVIPKFSVRPRHMLFVSTSQLILEAHFHIQTDVGSLDQLELEWPTAAAEGWRLDPASVSGEAAVSSSGDQLNQNGRLLIGWKSSQSGNIDLGLRFLKQVPAGEQSAQISLPKIRGARTQPSEMLVAAEDQLEIEVKGGEGVALPQLALDPHRLEETAPALISQIQKSFSLDPENLQVDLAWKPQPRVVEADAEVELRRATDGRVRVQQTIRFQSRFGRLSVVRFQLPKSLAALIPAGAAGSAIGVTIDGQRVVPQIRNGVVESSLTEPRLGSLLVTLEYSIPLVGNSPQNSVVPVLASLDAKYTSTRVRIPEGEPLRVPPASSGWQPVPTSPDATVWVTQSETQVPVILDADQTTSPRFSVDRAFYHTRFDNSGRIEGVCEFQWAGNIRSLPVTLPADSEFLGGMYNGVALNTTRGEVTVDATNPSLFQFRFPPAPGGSRLALLYRSTKKAVGFSHRDVRTVPLPQLPKDVSIVRSLWELELPVGRHLFLGPNDLTPEHEWQRSGLIWSRGPVVGYLEDREQSTIEARQLTTSNTPGHVYAFSSIGPIESPRFQSMTRSMILMLGAGLTLAMGFLFWSLPVTRNMLALLLLAFGVSLLSLWFLEPIQLLLQPALLGALLAILASLIDLKSRRPAISAFPASVLPIPVPKSASEMGESAPAGRGSSVARQRSTPMPPTAIYQPGNSEVGSP